MAQGKSQAPKVGAWKAERLAEEATSRYARRAARIVRGARMLEILLEAAGDVVKRLEKRQAKSLTKQELLRSASHFMTHAKITRFTAASAASQSARMFKTTRVKAWFRFLGVGFVGRCAPA